MAVNVISGSAGTAGAIPPAIQAFYDRNLLERAVPADIHGRFGQMRPISTRSGNQIKFRRYESLTPILTPTVEGVTPTGQLITVTEFLSSLTQLIGFVTISDLVDLTNQDAVLTEVGMVLGEQAGTSIDKLRRDVLVAGTNVIFTNGSTRAGLNTVLGSVALRTAIRFLGRQNAKYLRNFIGASEKISTQAVRSAYVGLVHPDTEAQLESIVNYIPVTEYSDAMQAEDDEIGSFRNIRFFRSTNCKVFLDAGAAVGTDGMTSNGGVNNDVYATLIIGANAYGVSPLSGNALVNIIKPRGSGGTSDPADQRATSAWKAITTTTILNQFFMTRIEHTNLNVLT
ncbi:MAG: N4-gp56 family major capsid protein [Nitrososphaera sp.]